MSGSLANPNVILQAGQGTTQPINLLAAAQQGQQLQANQNALQQQRAQQAIGADVQASIDPTTGQFDPSGFRARVAADPAAAYGAGAAVTDSQKQQLANYEVTAADLKQATSRAGIFSTSLNPLVAQGNNVTPQDVASVIGRLHAAGIPVDGAVAQMTQSMPTSGGAALHQWILQNAGTMMPSDTFLPKPTFVNAGGTVQAIDANPVTNAGATSASIPLTFSPSDQARPVPGPVTASGGNTTQPTAAFAASHGLGYLIPTTGRASLPPSLIGPGGMPGAGDSGTSGGSSTGAPGASAAVPPAVPASSGSAAPVAAPGAAAGVAGTGAGAAAASGGASPYGAPTVTSLGPAETAGLTVGGTASAQQWGQTQQAVSGSASRILTLQKAMDALQQLGTTGTGPGAAARNNFTSYVQSLPVVGPTAAGMIESPKNIANFDEANKYMTSYAAAMAGAHGATTDSQLATALSANASTHISSLAAQDVIRANIALERMGQSQVAAFQATTDPQTGRPLTPDRWSDFSATWNRSTDPRAFAVDMMNPQQVSTMLAGMSPADRAKFQSTYTTAVNHGWMSAPTWATPPSSAAATAAPAGTAAAPVPPQSGPVASPGGSVNGY